MHKKISDRISFERDKEFLEIHIKQQIPSWQFALLAGWLAAWFACGMYFIYAFNQTPSESPKFVWYIILGLWAFIFFRVAKVLIWRWRGKEVIGLKNGVFSIKNSYGGVGKPATFNVQHVKAFGKIKNDGNQFMGFLEKSFWSMGGETLGFNYMGKKYQFGKQLGDREVQALGQVVDKALREFNRRAKANQD